MSRDLTAGMETAFNQRNWIPAYLVELLLDSGTLRLWGGLGDLTALGETWTGSGPLGEISSLKEGSEIEAYGITLKLTITPTEEIPDAPDQFLNIALEEEYQGRVARVYLALFDADTEALIQDPTILFSGYIDVMQDEEVPGSASITLTAENRMVDLEKPRKRLYTPEDHKVYYSTDTFLDEVASLQNREIVLK